MRYGRWGDSGDRGDMGPMSWGDRGHMGELCIYVMTRLLKDGLCIKVTFMHNCCWVNHYEKCSLRWHICLRINQTNLIIMNNEFIMIRLYLEPWKVHMNLTEEAKLHCNFGCIFSPLHCVFHLPERRHSYIDCIFYFSPQCIFKCIFKPPAWEEA